MPPPVPARRHDPRLQNFIYKGKTSPEERRKDEEMVARLARQAREARVSTSPDGEGST